MGWWRAPNAVLGARRRVRVVRQARRPRGRARAGCRSRGAALTRELVPFLWGIADYRRAADNSAMTPEGKRSRRPATCEQCGKDFMARIDSYGRFCSRQCSGGWHSGKKDQNYKHGLTTNWALRRDRDERWLAKEQTRLELRNKPKCCSDCGEQKPLSEFHRHPDNQEDAPPIASHARPSECGSPAPATRPCMRARSATPQRVST